MRETLEKAADAVRAGRPEEAAAAVRLLKDRPRTEDGLFDLSGAGCGYWEAARLAYPAYAAYETACNKKEGYPDIAAQFRILDSKLNQDYTFANAACYVSMLMNVIDQISQEVYEYYRELVDLLRAAVRKAGDSFVAGAAPGSLDEAALGLFQEAVRRACACDILLEEKYQALLK